MNKQEFSGLRVLAIDDEPFQLQLLRRQFGLLGLVEVTLIDDARAALARVASAVVPFDLICCDLQMPSMDGVEFVRLLAATGFKGGLLLISGEDQRILQTARWLASAQSLNVVGALHKPVAFGIVPLFGFANAGVSLSGVGPDALLAPLPLGIAAGLFVGKQLGIFTSVWLAVKLRLADKPAHASWQQIYGVSLLCGIGFTMSLFIGGLAFEDHGMSDGVKMGVLMGSVIAALSGYVILRLGASKARS